MLKKMMIRCLLVVFALLLTLQGAPAMADNNKAGDVDAKHVHAMEEQGYKGQWNSSSYNRALLTACILTDLQENSNFNINCWNVSLSRAKSGDSYVLYEKQDDFYTVLLGDISSEAIIVIMYNARLGNAGYMVIEGLKLFGPVDVTIFRNIAYPDAVKNNTWDMTMAWNAVN